MTNIIETILISPVSYPLPLPMVIDVAPEIETKATNNNFWDLLDEEIVLKGEDASKFKEMLFDLEAIEERDAFIATKLSERIEKYK